MPELSLVSDLFEMVAAVAALGVTVVLYFETRYMRSEMKKIQSKLRSQLEELDTKQ